HFGNIDRGFLGRFLMGCRRIAASALYWDHAAYQLASAMVGPNNQSFLILRSRTRSVFHSRDTSGGGHSIIGGGGQQHGKCRYETNIHLFVCQHAVSDCYYHLMSSRRAGFVLGKGPTLIESVARGVFDAGSLCGLYPALIPLPAVESAIHSKHLKMHNFVSTIPARLWPTPEPLPVAQ